MFLNANVPNPNKRKADDQGRDNNDGNKKPNYVSPQVAQAAQNDGPRFIAKYLHTTHNQPVAFFYAPGMPVWYALAEGSLSCVTVLLQGIFDLPACAADASKTKGALGRGQFYCVGHNPSADDNGVLKFCTFPSRTASHLNFAGLNANQVYTNAVVRHIGLPSRVGENITTRNQLDRFDLTGLGPAPQHVDLSRTDREGRHRGHHTTHRLYMMTAYALIRNVIRGGQNRVGGGANVGVVLADRSGRVLAWGVNTNKLNYCFHAEVNTVQSFLKRGGVVQNGSQYYLYTTLKPCCMCAAVLRSVFGNQIRVYYGMDDPGPHASWTQLQGLQEALDARDMQQNARPIKFDLNKMRLPTPEGWAARWQPPQGAVNDLTTWLNTAYRSGANGNEILRFLYHVNTTYLMDCAVEAMRIKYEKYIDNEVNQLLNDVTGSQWQVRAVNQRVLSLVSHLAPFVFAHGAGQFDIKLVSGGAFG